MRVIEKMLDLIGRENGQSRSSALINDTKTVNELFLSTKMRLKSFNENERLEFDAC